MRAIDLTGERFGRLTVTGAASNTATGRAWRCTCDCGGTTVTATKNLRNGRTRSCGCMHIESALSKVRELTRPVGYERMTAKGYVEVKTARGFRRKHVHVMELELNAPIPRGFVVHHRDEDKTNNDPANLELMTHAQHTIHHNRERSHRA